MVSTGVSELSDACRGSYLYSLTMMELNLNANENYALAA
jgi:hypothetical protein